MTQRTKASWLSMVAGLAMAASALAAPPTQEQITGANEAFKAKTTELREAKNLTGETYGQAADEALAGLDFAEMTASQFNELSRLIAASTRTAEAKARLETLAKDSSADGAEAAVLVVVMTDGEASVEEQVTVLRTAMTHPGLRDALSEGRGANLLSQVGFAKDDAVRQLVPELRQLGSMVGGAMPAVVVVNGRYLYNAFLDLGDEHAEMREEMRGRLLRATREAAAKAEGAEKTRLENNARFLGGAFAKGELLNHAAPALTVEWSSDENIDGLDSLKGKVVILDFWATWCGPCIRSFPNVAELVSHYEGYPVAVVGVTSIQGAHYGEGGKIDCKDDPAKERSLMTGFMTEKKMTWPVIFTEEDVFNPDFGVNGIPHVAIIAPDGTVRYNGLHPSGDLAEKTAKIDAILKEFNLTAPPPLAKSE